MNLFLKDFIVADAVSGLDGVFSIIIKDGKIEKIAENLQAPDGFEVIDGEKKLAILPALFDMHVHFRDPGLTYKEDINSGAKCAIAGGFGAVACMPNTKPTIDTVETVSYIYEKAEKTGLKIYPVACITKNMQGNEICDFKSLKNAGAIAFSDDGKPVENAEILRKAMLLADENGSLIISHCEDLSIIDGGIINKGEVSKKLGVKGMDRASEDCVTAREIALAVSTDAHLHIAHVSTKASVQFIRDAKKCGYKITCETAPHYFMLTEEKLLKQDADYRMNPPLRTSDDVKAVLEGVLDGTIDCIITDHAPHSKEEKENFLTAPNGVTGLETSLAATLTALYHTKKLSLLEIAKIMSKNPAKILNISPFSLKIGEKANLIIVDLDMDWTVDPLKTFSKSKNTVFKGETLKGKVISTILNGKMEYKMQ